MNNENWNNSKQHYEVDPWERDTYQTGSTTPPKSHGGIIAMLLALAICMCGILTMAAVLKIQLFTQPEDPVDDTSPLSIQSNPDVTGPTASTQTDLPIRSEPHEDDIPNVTVNNSPLGADNIPQEGGLALQEIYEKCIPSVVSISCTLPDGTSTGTGVVVSEDGYIVTNAHVVDDAVAVQVILTGGTTLDAAMVGTDKISDLAVLWVDHDDLTPAELGDSNMLRVGDAVVAIGDPLGVTLRGTMTDGIISGINRDMVMDGRTMTLIQTTAALNEGNSGGPLINCYGQVVGINTMKIGDAMSYAGVEGLGFAIPSTTVSEIVNQLIGQGYVSGRPDLGLEGKAVSMMKQLYGRLPSGMELTAVDQDSDAYAKGIRPDDILLAINGIRINEPSDYEAQLYSFQVGDVVTVIIYRDGQQYELNLTVGEAGA